MLRTARGREFQTAILVATVFPHTLDGAESPMHSRHVHLIGVHQSELLADAHQFVDVGMAGVVAESVLDILHESVVYLVKSLSVPWQCLDQFVNASLLRFLQFFKVLHKLGVFDIRCRSRCCDFDISFVGVVAPLTIAREMTREASASQSPDCVEVRAL